MDIKLKGGKNFRDLGGLRNENGEQVKSKLFIRGGNLSKLKDKDVAFLTSNYDIASVIDLRTDTEMEEKQDRMLPGVEYVANPLFSGATAGISHERGASLEDMVRLNKDKQLLYNTIPVMEDLYKYMFLNEGAISQLAKAIHIIVDNAIAGRATIYHCTKGKDRTGITSLVILHMLGVPKKTIFKDYLRTNRMALPEGIKYWILITVFKQDPKSAGKLFNCFVARRSFLESIYTSAHDNYGSLDSFIRNNLGISDEKLSAFKEAALEKTK